MSLTGDFEKLAMPDAEVYFAPHFFDATQSQFYLQELLQQINWKQESIKLFGKETAMPRLTAWYGEKAYTYSGLENKPAPWIPVLLQLKEQVEQATGNSYNSVLLNLYRTGHDSMGWHSDDEAELGQAPAIASLSFGGERRFAFRHRFRKELASVRLALPSGSLLLMQGPTQHFWQHSIPKTAKTVQPRINLTFRQVQ